MGCGHYQKQLCLTSVIAKVCEPSLSGVLFIMLKKHLKTLEEMNLRSAMDWYYLVVVVVFIVFSQLF